MGRFLFKTEPSTYSFEDLLHDRHTTWDGVSNPLAVKHIRSLLEGDEIVIYHTGDERQAVGLARVIRAPYDDPKDAKAALVDILVGKRFMKPVTLKDMQQNPLFADCELIRQPRLSIVPLSETQWTEILRLAGMIARR